MLFPDDVTELAKRLLEACRAEGVMLATAESCTGGLIAGALTDIAGSSDVVDRGFVTYSNSAKIDMLKVSQDSLRDHGAVSEQVAREMAAGAINASRALVSIAVTGIAGPGGGTPDKPVGTVHVGIRYGSVSLHRKFEFGDIGRSKIRMETVRQSLALALDALNRF